MTCFEPRTKNHAFFKLLGMAATFWSAAVFRRFWGKRESPSVLDYDADLRAAEHRRTCIFTLPCLIAFEWEMKEGPPPGMQPQRR